MRKSSLFALAVAALFLAYALVLFHHTSFSAGGSDSSGYVNAARLLATGRTREPIRGLTRLGLSPDWAPVFTPLGYTASRQPDAMAPSYPPGLPVHMALAALLAGWSRGPFLVSPVAALACLALLYALGRELRLPPALALAGCALLAFAPTFVFQALQPMSDVPAAAWALAAVLAAYRARAGSGLWAGAAGAAFGIGVLVRPTNALVLLPLLVALPPRAKSWLSFAAGGIPFGVFHFLYSTAAFGSPWTTGYQSLLSEGLGLKNFPPARATTGTGRRASSRRGFRSAGWRSPPIIARRGATARFFRPGSRRSSSSTPSTRLTRHGGTRGSCFRLSRRSSWGPSWRRATSSSPRSRGRSAGGSRSLASS